MTGEGTGNREQEVLLPRFLLKTLEFQGGSDYSCSLPVSPDKSLFIAQD